MSTARESGLAALQNADYLAAITHLEAAVQQDPTDFQAHLYLGGAYGHAGRQLDAINILTAAVRLEPANAQARYNLGIAMDEGGYRDQSITVLQQALQLQPDYPKAQEALERIQHNPAHGNDGFGAPMSATSSTPTETDKTQSMGYGAPAAQPTAYGQPAQGYSPPGQPQPTAYGQPMQGYSPPGQAQPTYAPPSATTQMPAGAMPPGQAQTLYGQSPGQSEPGLGSYATPPAPKPFGQPGYAQPGATYASPGMNPYPSLPTYDDGFKLGRAFVEWGRALFTPAKLFSEMAGCSTNRSTFALLVVYILVYTLATLAISVIKGNPMFIAAITIVATPFIYLFVWSTFAAFVHMFSRAFGSVYSYGCSFRAVVYSAAPFLLMGIFSSILMPSMGSAFSGVAATHSTEGAIIRVQDQQSPFTSSPKGQPGQSDSPNPFGQSGQETSPFTSTSSSPFGQNPFSAGLFSPIAILLVLFGVLWGMILLGVAVQNIHQISGGAAAGVVLLSFIVSGIVYCVVWFLIALVIGLAFAGAAMHH